MKKNSILGNFKNTFTNVVRTTGTENELFTFLTVSL